MESILSQSAPSSTELLAVREKLGDCLARLDRWELATGKYGLAYDQALALANPDNAELRGRLALKLLDALLHQGDFQMATAHIKDISASLQLEKEALGKALDYLQTLLDTKNATSAAELIAILDTAMLPGLAKKPFKERFAKLKAHAQNRQKLSAN